MLVMDALRHVLPLETMLVTLNDIHRWQRELRALRALQRQKRLTVNETPVLQALETLNPLLSLLKPHASSTPHHLYSLLTTIEIEEIDKDIQPLFLAVLIECLQRGLAREEQPLYLLLHQPVDAPLFFAAYMAYLLQQNIAPQTIINAGLLHRYFATTCCDLETRCLPAYQLLADWAQEQPSNIKVRAEELLALANDNQGAFAYAVSGQLSHPRQPAIDVNHLPPFSCTKLEDNFQRLYALFEEEFLLNLAKQPHVQWLIQTLQQLNNIKLKALFDVLEKTLAENMRVPLLQHLGKSLTDKQLMNLIEECPWFSWLAYTAKPSLLYQTHPQKLLALVQQPLKQEHIGYATVLLKEPALEGYAEPLCHQIFTLSLQFPALQNDEINELLTKNPAKATQWCEDITTTNRHRLIECIKKEVQEADRLTIAHFHQWIDLYHQDKLQQKWLSTLTPVTLDYPDGNYPLKALVLTLFLEAHPEANAYEQTDVMLVQPNDYSEEETQRARLRVLYQTLAECDNECIQNRIISQLEREFNVFDWLEQRLASGESILLRALKKGNKTLLQRYFSSYQPNQYLEELNRFDSIIQEKYQQSLLIYCLTYPQSLKTLLSFYPKPIQLQKINETHAYDLTIVHLAAPSLEKLQALFSFLSPEECLQAANRLTNDEETLLHLCAGHPNCLSFVLSLYPIEQRLDAINQRNAYGDTVLHKAAHCPKSLQTLLELLPKESGYDAIKIMKKKHNTLLHAAYNHPQSLTVILSFLSISQRWELLNVHDLYRNTVFHRCVAQPASLQALLNALPSTYQQRVIHLLDGNDRPLIELAEEYPASHALLLAVKASITSLPPTQPLLSAATSRAQWFHRDTLPPSTEPPSSSPPPTP